MIVRDKDIGNCFSKELLFNLSASIYIEVQHELKLNCCKAVKLYCLRVKSGIARKGKRETYVPLKFF